MPSSRGQLARNVAALSLAVAACSGGHRTAFADSIAAKEQLCAACHGAQGLPSDHAVPIIWGQQPAYLEKQLTDYRNGDRASQIMSSIAESLSEAEIARVATDFGHRKWPAQAPTKPPAAPPAIAGCLGCHHSDLTGGISGAGIAPRLAGQLPSYLVDTMTAYADGDRGNSSLMPALMEGLPAADRTAIADYLAALR